MPLIVIIFWRLHLSIYRLSPWLQHSERTTLKQGDHSSEKIWKSGKSQGVFLFVRENDWCYGMRQKSSTMKMRNLKKRAESKSRIWPCLVKRAEIEARTFEERKRATVRSGNSAAINSSAFAHSCSNANPTTGSPGVSYLSLSIVPHAGSVK